MLDVFLSLSVEKVRATAFHLINSWLRFFFYYYGKVRFLSLLAPFTMNLPLVHAPLAVSRRIYLRPQSAQDWENQKAKITNLSGFNELKNTMKVLEEQHCFKATYAIPSNSFDLTLNLMRNALNLTFRAN